VFNNIYYDIITASTNSPYVQGAIFLRLKKFYRGINCLWLLSIITWTTVKSYVWYSPFTTFKIHFI